MNRRMKRIVFALIIIGVTATLAASVKAQQSVDCSAGGTITAALGSLKPGDTLLVRGTCNENITIRAEVARITLDGGGTATIRGADANANVLTVLGREITIRGFTITGGSNGINVVRGGAVIIDGNTIQNTGATGIGVTANSFAALVNNTIQNNNGIGVQVLDGSNARFGYTNNIATATPQGLPNIIRNNGQVGIRVANHSSANILGAAITNNRGDGVVVYRGSQANIANNTIDGNQGNAITVTEGSGADLDFGVGGGVPATPSNRTSAGMVNTEYGIGCSVGSYVFGSLATVTGTKGPTNFDSTCINFVKP